MAELKCTDGTIIQISESAETEFRCELLATAWQKRHKLRAEGSELIAKGEKLLAESKKLHSESKKLHAEGLALHAEGIKRWIKGSILWSNTILAVYGNIAIEWHGKNCHLENGQIYVNKP